MAQVSGLDNVEALLSTWTARACNICTFESLCCSCLMVSHLSTRKGVSPLFYLRISHMFAGQLSFVGSTNISLYDFTLKELSLTLEGIR